MALATTATHYTPEELLTLPDYGRFELIDGHLVARKMGARSSYAATNLLVLVGHFVRSNNLGSSFKRIVGTRSLSRIQIGSGLLTDHSCPVGNFLRIVPLQDTVVSPRLSLWKPYHPMIPRMKLKTKLCSGSVLVSGLSGYSTLRHSACRCTGQMALSPNGGRKNSLAEKM